jgi:dCMP deaminase
MPLYILSKKELEETKEYLKEAVKEARKSRCVKSQRGAVLVKNGRIIGRGHNKTTLPDLCNPCIREKISDNSRVELCAAIHAEQMAIIDAALNGKSIRGATLYHIKLKKGKPVPSGEPSCTVCSRLICAAGIKFVLWHENGYVIYEPREINELSFKYFLKK